MRFRDNSNNHYKPPVFNGKGLYKSGPQVFCRDKNKKKLFVNPLIDDVSSPVYMREQKNYYLQDLISYSRKFSFSDIKGPKHEINIINDLMNEFSNHNSLFNVFKPLEDLVCTSIPEGFNNEVDFLQGL